LRFNLVFSKRTSQFLHKSTGSKSPCKLTAATAALKIPGAPVLCEISFCQLYDELLSNKVLLKCLVCMIPQCFKTHLHIQALLCLCRYLPVLTSPQDVILYCRSALPIFYTGMTSYGMGFLFDQFGSAVLAVSPPRFCPFNPLAGRA
uniref:Uncharacterized protein n=1 Tax=Athene cunicularia TaxID=194338 RepID=A0A663N7J8_ATHCN